MLAILVPSESLNVARMKRVQYSRCNGHVHLSLWSSEMPLSTAAERPNLQVQPVAALPLQVCMPKQRESWQSPSDES